LSKNFVQIYKKLRRRKMKLLLMTCLAGFLLVAPTSVLAGKESPLGGQNVANL
jgi:hypothetical protein